MVPKTPLLGPSGRVINIKKHPKWLPTGAQGFPNGHQQSPRSAQGIPSGPQGIPDGAQGNPKGAQTIRKGTQMTCEAAPRNSQGTQNHP